MKESARYRKIVEWSEEDQCFVGSAPDLFLGGCHGPDERAVFDELCQIVEEWIEICKKDGTPLPPPSRASNRKPRRKGKATLGRGATRST
jgi:predicted RNase H-like HicB family nuclease